MRSRAEKGAPRRKAVDLLDGRSEASDHEPDTMVRDRYLEPEDFEILNSYKPEGFDGPSELARHIVRMTLLYPERNDEIQSGKEIAATLGDPASNMERIKYEDTDGGMPTLVDSHIANLALIAQLDPSRIAGINMDLVWKAGMKSLDESKKQLWQSALTLMGDLLILFPDRHSALRAHFDDNAAEKIKADVADYWRRSGWEMSVQLAAQARLFDNERDGEYYYDTGMRQKMDELYPIWLEQMRTNTQNRNVGAQMMARQIANRAIVEASRVVVSPERKIVLNPVELVEKAPPLPARD